MKSSAAIRKVFLFGQSRSSWCTGCNGARCGEDVRFLNDGRGSVQGYVIDAEKLGEAAARIYPGENRRVRNSSPTDGIYKRPLDIKKLLSRDPDSINTVRFSSDLLANLLVGVEGCDNFTRGPRRSQGRARPAGRLSSYEIED